MNSIVSTSLILFSIAVLLFSCKADKKKRAHTNDFVEDIVDFSIERKDNNTIELNSLHERLGQIRDDDTEELILSEVLKKRGFIVISWGRGNFSRGPRIVSRTLKKDQCFCEVNKKYNSVIMSDSLFEISESIRCSDSLTFYRR